MDRVEFPPRPGKANGGVGGVPEGRPRKPPAPAERGAPGLPPALKPGEGVECETDPLHRPAGRGRVGGRAGGHRAAPRPPALRGSGVCIGLQAVQPISAGCAPVDQPGGRGRVATAGPVDSERGLRSRGPDFRTAVRGERRPPAARCRGAARSLSRSPHGGLRVRLAAATTGFENRATATGPARFGLAVAWRIEARGPVRRRTPARRGRTARRDRALRLRCPTPSFPAPSPS